MLAFSQRLALWSSSKSRRRGDRERHLPGMPALRDVDASGGRGGPVSWTSCACCTTTATSRRACKSFLLSEAKRWTGAGTVPGLRRRLVALLALFALGCIWTTSSPASWYTRYRATGPAPDPLAPQVADSAYEAPQWQPQPQRRPEAVAEECDGRRVFMYHLPPQLNTGVLERCSGGMVSWLNFCPHALNGGFGKLLDFQSGAVPSNSSLFSDYFTRRVPPASSHDWDATSIQQQVLRDAHAYAGSRDADSNSESCGEKVQGRGGSWFATDAYMLEQIYHTRMFHYPCLTSDPDLASAFFLPYYAGLDALQYLYGDNRGRGNEHGQNLIAFLEGNASMRPYWKRRGGRDHFMVAGRTGWDFGLALESASDNWGTALFAQPALENVTFLVLEGRGWRHGFEQAVPYPTSFHPPLVTKRERPGRGGAIASKLLADSRGDGFGKQELREWTRKVRTARRTSLIAFAGAMRPGMATSIRGILHSQCLHANSNSNSNARPWSTTLNLTTESPSLLAHRRFHPVCAFVDCGSVKCSHNSQPAMDTFLHSEFCLQPSGDTATRRSTFDSIVAGCIPVFFHPDSAYTQYKWHLPEEASSYSVFIPEDSIRQGTRVEEVLRRFSQHQVQQLRAALLRLLPRVIYMDLVDDSSRRRCDAAASSQHGASRPPASSAHQWEPFMEDVQPEDAFDVSIKGVLTNIAPIPSLTPYKT